MKKTKRTGFFKKRNPQVVTQDGTQTHAFSKKEVWPALSNTEMVVGKKLYDTNLVNSNNY